MPSNSNSKTRGQSTSTRRPSPNWGYENSVSIEGILALVALLGVILLGLSPALVGALTQVTAGMIVFSGYVYARMAMNAGSEASLRRLQATAAERRNRTGAARGGVRSA